MAMRARPTFPQRLYPVQLPDVHIWGVTVCAAKGKGKGRGKKKQADEVVDMAVDDGTAAKKPLFKDKPKRSRRRK